MPKHDQHCDCPRHQAVGMSGAKHSQWRHKPRRKKRNENGGEDLPWVLGPLGLGPNSHFLTTGTHQLTQVAWFLVAPEASGHLGLCCPWTNDLTSYLEAQFYSISSLEVIVLAFPCRVVRL